MSIATENKKSVSNPERVTRLLNKMIDAQLHVLLSKPEHEDKRVKGTLGQLDAERGLLTVTQISENGSRFLQNSKTLSIEIAGMSLLVNCIASIESLHKDRVVFRTPLTLDFLDRRQNIRYKTLPKHSAYLDVPSLINPSHPFRQYFFSDTYSRLESSLRVIDLSDGGLCIESPFKENFDNLSTGMVERQAVLYIPNQEPLPTVAELRWKRMVKSNSYPGLPEVPRYGILLLNQEESIKNAIQNFLKTLSIAEAI